jgi:hypothetical protein
VVRELNIVRYANAGSVKGEGGKREESGESDCQDCVRYYCPRHTVPRKNQGGPATRLPARNVNEGFLPQRLKVGMETSSTVPGHDCIAC